jgi:hypothetical protein
MRRFAALAACCAPGNHPHEEKSLAWLHELPGARFQAATKIHAVVLPKVVPGADDTVVRRASARDALLALAPSSVLYMPAAGPRTMERLGALVERVPSYHLLLGREVSRIPARVAEILADAS